MAALDRYVRSKMDGTQQGFGLKMRAKKMSMVKTISAFGNEHSGAFCWHAEYRKRARSVKRSEIRPLFL